MPNTLNVKTFLITLATVFGLITLLTLLPSRYYFTFSQVVKKDHQSQFFAYKDFATPTVYCGMQRRAVGFDDDAMEPELLRACNTIERYTPRYRALFRSDAIHEGERLVSDRYREEMARTVDLIRSLAPSLENSLERGGNTIKGTLFGKSPGEIEEILISDQVLSMRSVLTYMLKDEDINYFNILQDLDRVYPEFRDQLGVLRDVYRADTEGFRNSEDWARLADAYVATTYRKEFEFLNERIHGVPTDNVYVAFILKLLPPLIAGFLVALFLRPEGLTEISLGTATAAFLLCWPAILLWNVVVSTGFRDQWPIMWVLYAAYIVAYYFFGKLGAQLGLRLRTSGLPKEVMAQIEWNKVFATVATTLITSSAVAVITWTFARAG